MPQFTTYDQMVTVWEEADQIPILEHGWLFDHFNPVQTDDLDATCLEGWSVLAALAGRTNRIRLGLLTAGNSYRHPAVHAHIASTVDNISHGRVDFGVGAGWNIYEHESMGIPLYPPGERIRRLGEAIELSKLLWTQPVTTYDGKYYQLKEARLNPKPVQKPHPPILIGGGGEQLTLRVAAKHADLWNFNGSDVETFRHKVAVLHRHCAEVGRDPREIELSAGFRIPFDDLPATARTIQSYVDAGVTHIVLTLMPPFTAGMPTRLAEELIPLIEAPRAN
jgi:F420-dependent oxidoreductase-like protein